MRRKQSLPSRNSQPPMWWQDPERLMQHPMIQQQQLHQQMQAEPIELQQVKQEHEQLPAAPQSETPFVLLAAPNQPTQQRRVDGFPTLSALLGYHPPAHQVQAAPQLPIPMAEQPLPATQPYFQPEALHSTAAQHCAAPRPGAQPQPLSFACFYARDQLLTKLRELSDRIERIDAHAAAFDKHTAYNLATAELNLTESRLMYYFWDIFQ